jgi:hypothetical protein
MGLLNLRDPLKVIGTLPIYLQVRAAGPGFRRPSADEVF